MTDNSIPNVPPIDDDAPRAIDEPATYDASTLDSSEPVTITAGAPSGSVTLAQHILGMEPYILIRAIKVDPDDEADDGLRLKVEHNDHAELATLYVLNLPAEQNPITAAIKAVLDANTEHSDYQVMVETFHLFAQFCDVPMPESGS